ncbi:MAG: methionyl-tRNA formyltransferase [Bacteroidota bacterium]
MIENPQIIFFGTPDFAVASLKALVTAGLNVVAVVTAVDKPAGRGLKPKPSPVKEYAETVKIPILQPANLKDPGFLAELSSFHPDLQIVIAFRMLPRQVWELPRMGTFNLHASLLPQYRGAAPINRAVMNGETETGITTFFLNEHIDAGKIILSRIFPIGAEETAGILHDRLMVAGARLVVETVDLIRSGSVSETSQESSATDLQKLKTAPKIFKEDCRIDWSRNGGSVFNFIRGLSPYPGAFTSFTGKDCINYDIKILKAAPVFCSHNFKPGSFFKSEKTQLIVTTPDGWLRILELQLQGRKVMSTGDFMRGYGYLFSEMQVI